MDYTIVNGDLTKAYEDIIVHQVNCQGVMGSGVAKCIRDSFPIVYDKYKELCMKTKPFDLLGMVQPVEINERQIVINMFSQLNYGCESQQYTDLYAFRSCLESINELGFGKSFAFPYNIGCVRGGADWNAVLPLILKTLKDVKSITFYKLDRG